MARAMNAHEFIAEFYRRRDEIVPEPTWADRPWSEVSSEPSVQHLTHAYRDALPPDRGARIIDIGFGNGEFMAAAALLGYTSIEGADFGADRRQGFRSWSPSITAIHNIETDIPSFLRGRTYDFIHLSHLIEHIPKYDLLTFLDAFHDALAPGGVLFIRTPNMDGPKPSSGRYATVTHEFGFNTFSMFALLQVCRFRNISFPTMRRPPLSLRQRAVRVLRDVLIGFNRFQHRMFGCFPEGGGVYSEELVVRAER
jgi:2-polyprenyl-3-methyl-5-hydroxy-6-metoxy-1,4-benzoquinol methylase